MRVLLVDDDESTRFVVKRALRKLGDFEVHEAASGEEAIQLLEERPVDAVLTDFRMPGKNGVDVLCHALEVQPQAHRLLMSGTFSAAILQAAADKECVNLAFEKPMNPTEWELRLRAALQTEAQPV